MVGLILVLAFITNARGQESADRLDSESFVGKKALVDTLDDANRKAQENSIPLANVEKMGRESDGDAKEIPGDGKNYALRKETAATDNQDAPKGDTQSTKINDSPMSDNAQTDGTKEDKVAKEGSKVQANADDEAGARVKKYTRKGEEDDYVDKGARPNDDYDDKMVNLAAEKKAGDEPAEERNPEIQFRAPGLPSKINERKSAFLSKGLKTELEGFNVSRSLAEVAECQQDIISIPGELN